IMHKLIRYINDRREHRDRWVEALQQADIPLRLINGPADPVSGRHMTERYRQLVPNPDIVLLDDAVGHYPQVEAPEAVLAAYAEFRA
ncbi:MAG: alpha/beta fold hydrolase, partial [Nevskiales bacterium]